MTTFSSVLLIFALLGTSEYLWEKRHLRGELSRKFVHILVGTFVAFWPYIMPWQAIQIISLLFVVVVYLSIRFKIFRAIHSVKRKTWGELLFAIGIVFCAFATDNPAIFTAAILNLSLADGLAAVAGTLWGKNNSYTILGQEKSIVGTMTFFVVSSLIMNAVIALNPELYGAQVFRLGFVLPLLLASVENVAVNGTDNLAVPALVLLAMT